MKKYRNRFTSPIILIKDYFKQTTGYSILRYIVELTLVIYILKFFTIFLWVPVVEVLYLILGYMPDLGQFEIDDVDKFDSLTLLSFFTLVPLVETVFGQWLPIKLVSYFTNKFVIKLIFSSLLFALFHVQVFLIITIFPAGLILAWTFLLYQKKSFKYAFWVTSAIHALHNFIALIFQHLV